MGFFVFFLMDFFVFFSSLEYDPRLYGLYLHDDQPLPNDVSMWDHLDETVPGYQDSLVLHMFCKPVTIGFEKDEERYKKKRERQIVIFIKYMYR